MTYGVPLRYSGSKVRVQRTGDVLKDLALKTHEELYTHQVTWSKKPNDCIGQCSVELEKHPDPEGDLYADVSPTKGHGKTIREVLGSEGGIFR